VHSIPRLLIVEPDAEWRAGCTATMKSAGFEVVEAETGVDAARLTKAWSPDGAICGWPLVGLLDCVALVRLLREYNEHMFIAVVGLEIHPSILREILAAGADLCFPGPYDCDTLMIHAEMALLRRSSVPESTLRAGDITVDIRTHQAWRGEIELSLTPNEFQCWYLWQNAQARSYLKQRSWKSVGGETTTFGLGEVT
jgi:two-component system OmpR family response regulator